MSSLTVLLAGAPSTCNHTTKPGKTQQLQDMTSTGPRALGSEQGSSHPDLQSKAHGSLQDGPEKLDYRQQPPRKRARMACTWCRDRKVRCDVSIHGKPCTNCQLDRHECALQQSVSRGRAAEIARLRKPTSRTNTLDRTPKVAIPQLAPKSPETPLSGIWKEGKAAINWDLQYDPKSPQDAPSSSHNNQSDLNVIFSFYSFLKLPDLPNIPPEDVKFLEMKGCLHIPPRTILDEFIRQYFLHVHPCLPVINEAEVWRIYRGKQDKPGKENSISLFTFQAMLFASCAFVPSKAVKLAGFDNIRVARNHLYYRAKLLFDLKAEKDVLAKAQGALLLTYQSSSAELHAGSIWLTVAIQNAIIYGAHVYGRDEELGNHGSQENIKKRLWWSILLRDRILPLGLRRHLQVTPQNFNLSLERITENDLQDEIEQSEVYDPETKRLLIHVLQVQCELAMVLTDVIMLVYAPNCFGQPRTMPEPLFSQKLREVEDSKANLQQWSNDAKSSIGSVLNSDKVHKSVTLYSGLTFLYYQAARLALCHFQAFTLETHQVYLGNSHERLLKPIREEVENAASCITDSVKGFLSQGVAHHLPISAIAYTALPLLLNALDVKLSASKSQSATRQRRFRYYAEVMQLYRDRYDGTDGVAVFIQQALRFADTLNIAITFQEKHGGSKQPESNGWSEVFARAPRLYLQLSSALDYAFTRGYFPEDSELPTLAGEPFIENRIPYSLSPPPISKTPRLPEAAAIGSPACEIPCDPSTEDQQQQPTPQESTSIAPMSKTYPSEPTFFDFNSMLESNKSYQQEASLSIQLPRAHKRSWSAQDHNLRDQGLDFLNFGSPTPEPQSASGQYGVDQRENYPGDQLNTMDLDTFLDLSNEMAESCYSAFPSNEDQGRRYSNDNLNTMGVHTAMSFGEEMPLWSDYMMNEILSPIPTQSGA